MFDHHSPLRLEKYHKFLQGKQLCNPCLTLVVSNHLEIYLLMLFPFENSSSCIDLELTSPFLCDLEIAKGINHDFKNEGFYRALHYGLDGGSNKGLACLLHFYNIFTKVY
jgi:hypothetical protein